MDMKELQTLLPDHEMVGGRMIVRHDGRSIEIGKTPADTGVFALTKEGREHIEQVRGGTLKKTPAKVRMTPRALKATPPDATLNLPEFEE